MQQAAAPTPNDINCANCGTRRIDLWCHHCGQHEKSAHRSIRRLLVEAIEHLTNADGRVFLTLKALAFHPAALTNAYLAGKRAAQVPPIQLFFVLLVLFLFIAEHSVHVVFGGLTAPQAALLPGWIKWLLPIGATIHAHGADFLSLLGQSAELFGLLTAPLAALLLGGLFAWRGYYLYDHFIFALHSLSFQFFILGVGQLLGDPYQSLLLLVMAAHLYMHMRGVYRSSAAGTVLRMALLALGTLVAYSALAVAWIAVAYLLLRV